MTRRPTADQFEVGLRAMAATGALSDVAGGPLDDAIDTGIRSVEHSHSIGFSAAGQRFGERCGSASNESPAAMEPRYRSAAGIPSAGLAGRLLRSPRRGACSTGRFSGAAVSSSDSVSGSGPSVASPDASSASSSTSSSAVTTGLSGPPFVFLGLPAASAAPAVARRRICHRTKMAASTAMAAAAL